MMKQSGRIDVRRSRCEFSFKISAILRNYPLSRMKAIGHGTSPLVLSEQEW
jgi:hypothetical protein